MNRNALFLVLALTISSVACEKHEAEENWWRDPIYSCDLDSRAKANDDRHRHKSLLTWADALKLCVPFLFSLIVIWATHKFNIRAERKAKRRLFLNARGTMADYSVASASLQVVKDAIKENKIRMFSFDVPTVITHFAERLAELDPKNAVEYVSYSSTADLVRNGNRMYLELVKSFVTASQDNGLCRLALFRQIRALKGDLVRLAQADLELIKAVQKATGRHDADVIRNLEAEIVKTQELFDADDGT